MVCNESKAHDHPGAVEWAAQQGLLIGRTVDHFDTAEVLPNDIVIGTLPVHLAAVVCSRGARYMHLTLELAAGWRGRELPAEELARCGAHLVEFTVVREELPPSAGG